ncbi:UNVERIFIED_CONTAM: Jasmonoyl--L-amino acid synthetase JAR6 [Sesamum radiatum]|uniref:Jasmonoyl--L-amino acid synthetase JAR6 n=1 Tax=Sesamum radiatum TaxID=300843 RepID=A0AAW2KTU0_SESRA
MLEKMGDRLDTEAVIQEFELMSMDAGRVQREILKKILEDNGETEYLLKWGLNGRTDPESYRACVPIVTHMDLEPYIQRIADGEKSSILTGKPISTISLSSGTTQGKPKYVPFNDELIGCTMKMYKTSFSFRNRGSKCCDCNYQRVPERRVQETMRAMQTPCCSPDEVIFGDNFHHSLYCHLLCALIFRDEVEVVSSTFAHSIVHAFQTFEQVWKELVADIRDGSLSSRITSKSIQSAMAKLLKPDPELAETIHNKCLGLSNWYGLIPELFPNAKYVYGIMTGSMEPYLKKLRHYAGELPLLSADYGASEGWIGVNINPKLPPELATFAVRPDNAYFEFIPLENNLNALEVSVEPRPVGLTEVEVGKEYEVIMTNFAGLYRYRLGDVVKVRGFHNSTPELQFICRKNLLLNINIDKNTEKDLQLAVATAANLLAEEKLEIIDFTSLADLSTEPGHYVIFWEISGNADDELLQKCCNCLDGAFLDAGYISSRKVNAIGALELRILMKGTFHKIMENFVQLGAAVNQFKTPRCVGPTNSRVLEILSNNVVKSYFSTAFS